MHAFLVTKLKMGIEVHITICVFFSAIILPMVTVQDVMV